MKSVTFELKDLESVASELIKFADKESVWVFQGQMGAGKTTLIKALATKFGILDPVSSPTFGIVNQYENVDGKVFYHFDFYRIDDPKEALDIGIEEYFYSGNYCWIEWAEKIEAFLPESFFLIKIDLVSEKKRKLTFKHINEAI